MKKEAIIILLIISLLFLFVSSINSEKVIGTGSTVITGESITGEATDAGLAISVGVSVELPNVIIVKPKNHTYITTKNLQLNFTSSTAQTIWYNIDQLGSNITVTGNTTFNTTQGNHILYLYANNTDGNESSDNITFTVDQNKFKVYYENYAGANKGSSTDFNISSYEELQNLSGIILENTNYGKIFFNVTINVTDDANISDNEIDLDFYTNISHNHTEINSITLPNFNKPATLYLYNLTFSYPRILRDGSICPDSICTKISYSGGTLKFNVTQFTIYSAEETPVEEIPEEEAPLGGGGFFKDFSLSEDEIKVSLRQGQIITKNITIKNRGNQKLNVELEISELENLMKIDEQNFVLNPKESKTILIDILAREDIPPNLYFGKLIIKANGIEKEILVAIEIESKKPLFDVKVEIPKKYLYIMPGEKLLAKIELYTLGITEKADVFMEYIIRDTNNRNKIYENETIEVEIQKNNEKIFKIPEDAESGIYVLYIKATYDNKTASATAWFNVGKRPFWHYEIVLFMIINIGILITIIAIIIIRKKRKVKKRERLKKLARYVKREDK